MAASGKKPGIKDISDLKARLGLTKSKMEPAEKGEGDAPADGGGDAAPAPAAAAPAPAIPAGKPPAAAAPAPAAPAPAAPAPVLAAPAPAAPAPAAPAPALAAPSPLAAPAPANPLAASNPLAAGGGLSLGAPPPAAAAPAPAAAAPAPAAPAPAVDDDDDDDDAYDYAEPQANQEPAFDPNQFDPDIKQPRSPLKLIVVGAIVFLVAIASFMLGRSLEGILNDRQDVNRRIGTAETLLDKAKPKIEAYNQFIDPYIKKAEAGGGMPSVFAYDKTLFEHTKNFQNFDFALDPSSDIPPEAMLLAQNANENPLPELRDYSYGTLLLLQLLGAHVNATNADKTEIDELLADAGGQGALAIQFDGTAYAGMVGMETPVDAENGIFVTPPISADAIKPLVRPVINVEEATTLWKEKGLAGEGGPEAPPRALVELQNKGGETMFTTIDNVLLIKRDQLFKSKDNALTRYSKRMEQMMKIVVEVQKSAGPLLKKIEAQAGEEKI